LASSRRVDPLPSPLKRYLAIVFVFSLGNSSDAFLLLRAKGLGLSAPLLWAVFHVVKLVTSYTFGAASDRLPRTRLIIVGWIVYAATYAGFAFATAKWQVWALFLVYGAYYGLTEPAEKALVKDLAPAEARGRAYGAYNLIVGITSLPAGLATGALWRAFGAPVALAGAASLAIIAAVLLSGARVGRKS
jgi:MFS family permease